MKKTNILPLIIFASIFAIFFIYYQALNNTNWPFQGLSNEQKGQFGDSFGALSSLFSALGFGGVLLTIWYQHKTIEKTNSRAELQQFESILFQMLTTHNSIISDIDIQSRAGGEVIFKGRDCFHRYYTKHLKPAYKRRKLDIPTASELETICAAYETVWLRNRQNLGHYFRFIYNIFLFIDTSEISATSKQKYSRIVRSQISDYELLMLFYNCLYKNGKEKFKPLVEKYSIFNNLPTELILSKSHLSFYENSAFTPTALPT
jgi:hypothetical protein